MDAAAPALALGIAIGRIGDLVIADHLGAPTTLPFGFRCPAVVDVGRTVGSRCPPGEVVHLTALYDLIAVSAVLGLLLWARRRPRPEGELSLIAAIAYGVGRFAFDFLRADVRRLGLTASQWVAVAVVGLAIAALVRRRRSRVDAPSASVDAGDDDETPEQLDEGTAGRRPERVRRSGSHRRVEQTEEPGASSGDDQGEEEIELVVAARHEIDIEDGEVVHHRNCDAEDDDQPTERLVQSGRMRKGRRGAV